ncbi:hypothetical protein JCM8547_003510 [Rhodosporidiobolus lusitaniae]
MSTSKTPLRFATDRTNLPSSSFASSSFSPANTPSSRLPSRPSHPSTWRQTSLADSFSRSSPSSSSAATAAASSSPLFAPDDASSTRTAATSSPLRCGVDENGDCAMEVDEREEQRGVKRRRVSFADEVDEEEENVIEKEEEDEQEPLAVFRPRGGKERMQPTFNVPGSQGSVFWGMKRRELGFSAGGKQVSMRPWLQTMMSSNEEDVTRIPSIRSNRNFAPPFAVAFSNAAKAGGKKILAVGDEEGMVSFLSAEKERWSRGPSRHSFPAHDNAIFDVRWSPDDQFLATASGDCTTRVWDVRTQTCVAVLAGHTTTVKNVSFDPFSPHLLSTASRDGSIRVWDRRVEAKNSEHGELGVATVNQIKNAHGLKGKGGPKGRSATRSVTAVTYLAHQPNLLASSGSSDSVIKIWDLRRSHSRRVNPQSFETNEDSVLSLQSASSPSARPHGIASMSLAPDGRRLYALSTGSQIFSFSPLFLSSPTPLTTFTSPHARFSSFYIRCAVSPCSRYLAAGSFDGGVLSWDTEGDGKDAVRVVGHEKEVSGMDWCAGEGLATCSDDSLVRFWQPNQRVSRLRLPKEKSLFGEAEKEESGEAYERMKARERWSGEAVEEEEKEDGMVA